jgi:hypothetical protein
MARRSPITEKLYADRMKKAVHVQSLVQFRFDTDLVLPYQIDEVSILWRTVTQLYDFASFARESGCDVFNARVHDHMHRLDLKEGFDVSFEFLRIPPHEWRVEAMACGQGRAPLHQYQLNKMDNGCIMHASFKVPDKEAYKKAFDELKEAGLVFGAQYHNSYGAFSYWSGLGNVWVKPRVNLRDAPANTTERPEP